MSLKLMSQTIKLYRKLRFNIDVTNSSISEDEVTVQSQYLEAVYWLKFNNFWIFVL